jgi:hypothetical protein
MAQGFFRVMTSTGQQSGFTLYSQRLAGSAHGQA